MKADKISTLFYPNKKQTETINGLDIVHQYGSVTPMIHIRNIYHGNHGSTDYNPSIQINIVKALFKEKPFLIPDFIFDEEK